VGADDCRQDYGHHAVGGIQQGEGAVVGRLGRVALLGRWAPRRRPGSRVTPRPCDQLLSTTRARSRGTAAPRRHSATGMPSGPGAAPGRDCRSARRTSASDTEGAPAAAASSGWMRGCDRTAASTALSACGSGGRAADMPAKKRAMVPAMAWPSVVRPPLCARSAPTCREALGGRMSLDISGDGRSPSRSHMWLYLARCSAESAVERRAAE
jgi:hypothetical protein